MKMFLTRYFLSTGAIEPVEVECHAPGSMAWVRVLTGGYMVSHKPGKDVFYTKQQAWQDATARISDALAGLDRKKTKLNKLTNKLAKFLTDDTQ